MNRTVVVHAAEELRTGGMERNLANIAMGLDKAKYKVIVVGIYKGGPVADELKAEGIDVRVLGIKSYFNPVNILKLSAFLRKEKVEILHTHTYFSNTIGRIAAWMAGVPIIIAHIQNVYNNYTKRNLRVERMLSGVTDKIICCSGAVREFAEYVEKIPSEKLVVVLNSVDVGLFTGGGDVSSLRSSLGLDPEDKIIITVASLTEKKGHRYFLEALKGIVEDSAVKVKYLVAGSGPLEEDLKDLVKRNGLESSVKFIGERKDVQDILRLSDLFVLPSLVEGLPLCVIEAMASGLPVVATDVGGTSEIVKDGVNGVLVRPKDPEALKTAVINIMFDEEKAREMSEAGRRLDLESFSSEAMVSRIDGIYRGIIDEKSYKGAFHS